MISLERGYKSDNKISVSPVTMRKGLVKPYSRDGQERIPLVGVSRQANGGFLRAGSCLGDPQVSSSVNIWDCLY